MVDGWLLRKFCYLVVIDFSNLIIDKNRSSPESHIETRIRTWRIDFVICVMLGMWWIGGFHREKSLRTYGSIKIYEDSLLLNTSCLVC